ncbi:hypothetical protein [Paenibacillus sp.]|nr:hypothetical protein [Paenibacillus sp.]HZG86184.1 hypothetical protein [Paenibacillus sp.]
MKDKQRYLDETGLSVWRGIFYGILFGVCMWAVILWLVWSWLF